MLELTKSTFTNLVFDTNLLCSIKKNYTHTISKNTYIKLRSQGKVLQFELKADEHIIGRDRSLADLVVPEDWQVMGRIQAVLPKEGQNYRIYDGDGKKLVQTVCMFITAVLLLIRDIYLEAELISKSVKTLKI